MSMPVASTIFTISRLNQTVRLLLEKEMGQIWLTGEISNFSQPVSGHWYFTLKDQHAQVRCAMFRHSQQRAILIPKNGHQVLVRANITLYEPRGDYQLIIENMQPAGDGLLQQQFEQLKQTLQTEGLFAAQHKMSLPVFTKQLGIITSATGAALQDILQVLNRRDPSLPVIIYPTLVQGKEAVSQVVSAIELANQRQECDVLIIARGGGSLEDLWCFNDERIARTIFASQIPIVSAIGHEIDVTIADFVADLRAPTPSAAAELVSRNQPELQRQLQSQQQRLTMALDYYLAEQHRRVTLLTHRLQQQHPQLGLARQQAIIVAFNHRLTHAWQALFKRWMIQNEQLQLRLQKACPQEVIRDYQQRLQQQRFLLNQQMQQHLSQLKHQFAIRCAELEGASPLGTLARGYSVVQLTDGQVVRSITQLKTNDRLNTRVEDGWIESTVINTTHLF